MQPKEDTASCLAVLFCLLTPNGVFFSILVGGGPSETPNIPPFLGGLYFVILTIVEFLCYVLVIYVLTTVLCPLLFSFPPLPHLFSLLPLILLGVLYLWDVNPGSPALVLRYEITLEKQQMDALTFWRMTTWMGKQMHFLLLYLP